MVSVNSKLTVGDISTEIILEYRVLCIRPVAPLQS